ncbi:MULTISPECIES: endonuclease III [Methanosarcina]|uniref:Endonuclease III n=3 Tax=Methanosarcina barkeri TaxID=2208 RepID=A0A0E3LP95_METBA|nr:MULTISPECIES: endonuclease III [Methanosarcina]AKB56131.1 Endonuclease III [Methanosarcina barkeri MS]AKB59608.1 Endonuclease III [Methanosarcina barkeri 227]AKJ40273.1 endonuclease III Nth [Methanosarcina barkeri CM1]OED12494.1 endonuclease III [Methanosarcina sp. A14]
MPERKPKKPDTQDFFSEYDIPDNRHNFYRIWALLKEEYPDVKPSLNYSNPLELLVATVLSAQSTDVQINRVTDKLFKKYRTARDYASADLRELENDLYSTGFYKSKAKNIKTAAQMIVEKYNGEVPKTMEELTSLPGVGRKTANIVLARAFGIVEGVAVDTHVKRVSRRLGLTKNSDPAKIEQDLISLARREDLDSISMTLIYHGRKVCQAKKPKCKICIVKDLCPSSVIFISSA